MVLIIIEATLYTKLSCLFPTIYSKIFVANIMIILHIEETQVGVLVLYTLL